jgi:hypothetical protein
VREKLMGSQPEEFFGKMAVLIAKPRTWENVIFVIMDQIK